MATDNPLFPDGRTPRPLILDGGLATALESKGFDLTDPLWSARLLVEDLDAVRDVHTEYLMAGADCIATVSYQATIPGFMDRGLTRDEAAGLLRDAARIAVEARDEFWSEIQNRAGRRRPLVAASVGPYGAFLADGSEYTGDYGLDADALYDFHRERWHIFAGGPADVLACETIPSVTEAEALLRLLRERPETWAWLSFSCRDGERLSDGTPIGEVAQRCGEVANVAALSVNCTKPRYIQSLVERMRSATDVPILVYPNAGEEYDAHAHAWREGSQDLNWTDAAPAWVESGAWGVGGCCRVGPAQIAGLRGILAS